MSGTTQPQPSRIASVWSSTARVAISEKVKEGLYYFDHRTKDLDICLFCGNGCFTDFALGVVKYSVFPLEGMNTLLDKAVRITLDKIH